MTTKPSELHMISLSLDPARVMAAGRRMGLPPHHADTGYLVHGQIGELFGDLRPRLFHLASTQGARWRVLAYGHNPADSLRRHAAQFADPTVHAAVDWETFASKAMPRAWSEGQRLGFEVRVCPVIRKSGQGEKHRPGAEVDVFLARCWSAGEGTAVDREEVYREWFASQLARHGGAISKATRVERMQRHHLVRRTQGETRKAHVLERPDVTLSGELVVTDPEAFNGLLVRGIGRHRSFGFGMLMLKPASPC